MMPREVLPRRPGRSKVALFAALTALACLCCGSVGQALQYQRLPLDAPAVLILLRGPIISGDFHRFMEFLKTMPPADRIAFALDSPGGNVLEAEKLARVIKRLDAAAFVGEESECSLACFLLFAAASRRIVRPEALIGVHSVSENGEETEASMAVTTAMARELGGLGVSPAIIGKLVQTRPGRATWLTPSDLASMGVTVLDAANSAPSQYAVPPAAPPSPPPSAQSDQLAGAYGQGFADRRAWERWFAGLAGAFKDGAEYWSGHRSTPRPGSCYGPAGENLGDWTAGCLAAKRILNPADIRRKAEPEYRAGWNSYSG